MAVLTECPVCAMDGIRTTLHNGACWKHGTQTMRVAGMRSRLQQVVNAHVKQATTVFEIWQLWKVAVLRDVTNPVQIEETRRAFYGGAAAMLDLMQRVAPDDVSEDQGVVILQALQDELKAFATDMRKV